MIILHIWHQVVLLLAQRTTVASSYLLQHSISSLTLRYSLLFNPDEIYILSHTNITGVIDLIHLYARSTTGV